MFAFVCLYLASTRVQLYGREERVKDHVAGLDVDWRLPLPHRAQVPGRVDQPPERWHCNTKDSEGDQKGEHVHRRDRSHQEVTQFVLQHFFFF